MNKPQWIDELFASIDAKDSDKFLSFLTEDAAFAFANFPPAIGQNAIREFLGNFFNSINGLQHTINQVIISSTSIICKGIVTYTRLNGTELSVKFCNVFDVVVDKVKYYDIYIDASILYEN